MRIAVLCRDSGDAIDAIRDNSLLVAEALRGLGVVADVRLRSPGNPWGLGDELGGYDAVLLAYSPFLYGRRGFAPWLPAAIWRLRLRARRPRIALVVHETYVRMQGWRWTLMGLWQRVQLHALLVAADVVFVSVRGWEREVGPPWTRHPVVHLPSGSNLPDMRDAREASRRRLGAGPETLVVATLATDHPSHMEDYAEATLAALAERGDRVVVLALGARAPASRRLPDGVDVYSPGRLPAKGLARLLAAADLFLAPFDDGVSTRRTSVMSALQHAVPVVGTDGVSTDDLLRDSGALRLVPVGRPDLFAGAAAALAAHPDERRVLGGAGRTLYDRAFDWPVLAERVVDGLRDAS